MDQALFLLVRSVTITGPVRGYNDAGESVGSAGEGQKKDRRKKV